jgi:hypothetical protein
MERSSYPNRGRLYFIAFVPQCAGKRAMNINTQIGLMLLGQSTIIAVTTKTVPFPLHGGEKLHDR